MSVPRVFLGVLAMLTCASVSTAQQPTPAPQPPLPPPIARAVVAPARVVSLEVRLQITRSQGQKVLSSRPYVIAVNVPGGNSQLNLGNEVPIPTTTFTPAGDGKSTPNPLFRRIEVRVYTNPQHDRMLAELVGILPRP